MLHLLLFIILHYKNNLLASRLHKLKERLEKNGLSAHDWLIETQ